MGSGCMKPRGCQLSIDVICVDEITTPDMVRESSRTGRIGINLTALSARTDNQRSFSTRDQQLRTSETLKPRSTASPSLYHIGMSADSLISYCRKTKRALACFVSTNQIVFGDCALQPSPGTRGLVIWQGGKVTHESSIRQPQSGILEPKNTIL